MKKYINKIVLIIAFIFIFVMAINIDVKGRVSKFANSIANSSDNLGVKTCDGTYNETNTYYVKSGSFNFWNFSNYITVDVFDQYGNKTGATLNTCTMVTVYCKRTYGGTTYYKISKANNKYVDADQVTTSLPSVCGGATQTEKERVTFSNLTSTVAKNPSYDKAYANTNSTITLKMDNLSNVIASDTGLFRVTVTNPNGVNVTSSFQQSKVIDTSSSNKKMTITLKMQGAENNSLFVPGQYKVVVETDDYSAETKFTLDGYYYNYTAELKQTASSTSIFANKINTWEVSINNRNNIDYGSNCGSLTAGKSDTCNFSFVIYKNGKDVTKNFKITGNTSNNKFTIKNNTRGFFYTGSGTYDVYIYYSNEAYSTAVTNNLGRKTGEIGYKLDNINIMLKKVDFHEASENRLELYRFTWKDITSDVTINIMNLKTTGDDQQIIFYENDNTWTTTMSLDEFVSIYTIDTTGIETDTNGKVLFKYSDDLIITKYLQGVSEETSYITYKDSADVTTTQTVTAFKTANEEAYNSFIEKYTSDSTGNILYISTGTKTVNTPIPDADKSKSILSGQGGRFIFNFNYTDLDDNDFETATLKIYKDDGTGNTQANPDEFSIVSWTHDGSKSQITLDYTGRNNDNEGDYYILISFKDSETIKAPFQLYTGPVDYYLSTAVNDGSDSLGDQLNAPYPPGNKRFAQEIAFNLVQGGIKLTKKSADNIRVKIYDCLIGYDRTLNKNYLYNQEFFTLTMDRVYTGSDSNQYIDYRIVTVNTDNSFEYSETKTLLLSEFASKYPNAYKYINNFVFDADGNITNQIKMSDGKTINLLSYIDQDNSMYVTYIENGTKKTILSSEFKAEYNEIYGMLETVLFEDQEGNVVLGGITSSNEIKITDGSTPDDHLLYSTGIKEEYFDVTINTDPTEIKKAIVIQPLTEVYPGTYYVYVDYGSLYGTGYINDEIYWGEDEMPLDKSNYPELYGQNTHMTSITYDYPEYEITLEEPATGPLSNEKNDIKKIYNNVTGFAKYNIKAKYIYDYSGITFNIERCISEDCVTINDSTRWEDITTQGYFTLINSLEQGEFYDDKNPYVLLTTNLSNFETGVIPSGKYRLTVNYDNDIFGDVKVDTHNSITFDISGEYYGLSIDGTKEINFVRNYAPTKDQVIRAKASFISEEELNNIEISIKRKRSNSTDIILENDKDNKRFYYLNEAGERVDAFKYSSYIDSSYYENPNEILYQFQFANIAYGAEIGDYELSFKYKTETGDLATTSVDFKVLKDAYEFEIDTEHPNAIANDDIMQVSYEVQTRFINKDDLENLVFTVLYSGETMDNYVEVSGSKATIPMFTTSYNKDNFVCTENSAGEEVCTGTVYLTVRDKTLLDLNGHYLIEVIYQDESGKTLQTYEGTIGYLRDIFDWKINEMTIEGRFENEDEPIIFDDSTGYYLYKNFDSAKISIDLKSIYTKNVSWKIVTADDYSSPSFDPTTGTSFNQEYFNEELNETTGGGKLEISTKPGKSLDPGQYVLVLYYGTDMRIKRFTVLDEYVNIQFGNPVISSEVASNNPVNKLYLTNKGYIHVPLKIVGIDYSLANVMVTNVNGTGDYLSNSIFTYEQADINNNHELNMIFNNTIAQANNMVSGRYNITVYYKNTSKSLTIDIYDTYFDFTIGAPTYTPDPIVPNATEGGQATFRISTDSLGNVENIRDTFADNTRIYDINNNVVYDKEEGIGVTLFNVEATKAYSANGDLSYSDFNLVVYVTPNGDDYVTPGYYTIQTYYSIGNNKQTKTKSFSVGAYSKTFAITRIEYISTTNDGKVHRNIGGTIRLHYSSPFVIDKNNMNVEVMDLANNVSNKFTINKTDDYIDIVLDSSKPYIDAGEYNVVIEYEEDGKSLSKTQQIKISGIYKDIQLSNMTASSTTIYSDIIGGYYTFDVNKTVLEQSDFDKFLVRVFDAEGNVVYSDFTDDKYDKVVTDTFDIQNRIDHTEDNFKISIVPFKARTGEYTIKLYLINEENEYNESNGLPFTITNNYYKVTLSLDSELKQSVSYNGDTTSIYDIDPFSGFYKFTTSYNTSDLSVFSIKVYKGLKEVQSINFDGEEITDPLDSLDYVQGNFDVSALNYDGTYSVAVCINGLPYTWLDQEIKEFIEISNINILINNNKVNNGDTTNIYEGINNTFEIEYTPANATDIGFIVEDNNGLITYESNILVGNSSGTTTLKISNTKGELATITLNINKRLSSNTYIIDYNQKTIYVNSIRNRTYTLSNLKNNLIYNGTLKVYTANNIEITNNSGSTLVGTGSIVENGGEQYRLIIIGDFTGDGNINLGDVAKLYQYTRGKIDVTDNVYITAAKIRKASTVNLGDVAKLYQFVRGIINQL